MVFILMIRGGYRGKDGENVGAVLRIQIKPLMISKILDTGRHLKQHSGFAIMEDALKLPIGI